jgi:hypothetical protein
MSDRRIQTVPFNVNTPNAPAARTDEQIRKALWLELLSACCEPGRAVLRCALSLLSGAQEFEIDPVTGVSRTLASYERAAASWAREYVWYERKDDAQTNPYRHDLVMQAREVQAGYVAVHPQLAGAPWFPDHGPHSCVFCLMDANEAAGLPAETSMDPVTGGVAKLITEDAL